MKITRKISAGDRQLALQVEEAEQQALHEVGERQQQRQVEEDALDHVGRHLLHVRVGAALEAPRGAGVGVEALPVLRVAVALCGGLIAFMALRVQAGDALVAVHVQDAVLGQPPHPEVVQPPHILGDVQRGVVDRAGFGDLLRRVVLAASPRCRRSARRSASLCGLPATR